MDDIKRISEDEFLVQPPTPDPVKITITDLQAQIKALQEDRDGFKNQISPLQATVDADEAKIADLQAQIDTLSALPIQS